MLLAARSNQLLLHASLDPYNTTDEMAVGFTDMELEWEEALVKVRGTLDVHVRTASKYDNGHRLNMPGVFLADSEDGVGGPGQPLGPPLSDALRPRQAARVLQQSGQTRGLYSSDVIQHV